MKILVSTDTSCLTSKNTFEKYDISEEFAHEKLSPVLAMYKFSKIKDAFKIASKSFCNDSNGFSK